MLVARCLWAFTSVYNFMLTCVHSCICLFRFFGCFFFVSSLHHCILIDNLHPSLAKICYYADFMFDLHPFKGSCHFTFFVINLHPSRWNLVTCQFFMTYTHLRVFVISLASSITYICLGGILLLSQFFMTNTHLRDLVISLASSVTYIRLSGILLLSHFLMTYTHLRDLVISLASSVTYICVSHKMTRPACIDTLAE